MSANVFAFPTATTAPTGPLRFTTSQRSAIMAAGYVPGLEAFIEACDDGDEYAAIGAAEARFRPMGVTSIAVVPEGFRVSSGTADLGTFKSIGSAVAAARRDVEERKGTFDPLADLEAWREVMESVGALPARN